MTFVGRFLVRVVGYVALLFILAAIATFLISKIPWLMSLAVLLLFFVFDYFVFRKEADRSLFEIPKKGGVNLADYVGPAAFSVLERALDKSSLNKTNLTMEIMKQIIGTPSVKEGLMRMDVPYSDFAEKTENFLKEYPEGGADTKAEKLQEIESLVSKAFLRAVEKKHDNIETSDLFSAMSASGNELVERLFAVFSIEREDLEKALIFSSARGQFSKISKVPNSLGGFWMGGDMRKRHRVMNRAWTSRPTPTLDKYSIDLTDLARREQVGFLVGHKTEYQRLVDTLARAINPNVMLVGEEGIGKETIVARLAFSIIKDEVPEPLFDKRLVSLQLGEMVAGASQEELQSRLQKIVEEIGMAGNVVLYLPEIHNLVKTSGTAYLSAADALVPIIKNNEFPIIGSTYPREFKGDIESRSDIVGLFEVVHVKEITEEEAEEVLVYQSLILEKKEKVVISFGAIKKAVKLAKKYFTNKFLPSSAGDLLKSALSEAKRNGEKVLQVEMVIRTAEEEVNVPIHEAKEEEIEKLINLEKIIHERLVDQVEAVKVVSDVLREYRSGLTKAGKPIANFLFVGPTGVGKTELSKILAELMFGSKEMMARFDMTEYQDKQSFFRFIGSPDGKVSGALTDAILKKPYSLILLDEFEKAYPDILNLFLQVFDDGRLTDNLGRTVDFQNTIIIATSNAHSDIINEALRSGQKMSDIGEYLKKKLTDVFKPELLNRFSKIVVFNDLSAEDVAKIAAINLKEFAKTLGEQGITLNFEEEAVKEIAKLGYDPAFGARPLQRVIEEKLRAPLAQKILKKELKRGGSYKIGVKNSEFTFTE